MIKVLFFGRIADLMTLRKLSLDIPASGLTLLSVRDQIFAALITGGQLDIQALRMSVNQVVVFEDQPLNSGDEVAFFSLFSGG